MPVGDGAASAFARRVFNEGKVDGTDFATFTYMDGGYEGMGDSIRSLATEYDHYYFSPEPLNALERSPFKDPSFERHAYEGGDPMDNHGRTNSGNDDNYDLIVDFIAESRGD